MFHRFFNSLAKSRYLSLFLLSFNFTLWSAETAKSTIFQVLFFLFLLIIIRSCNLAEIWWSVCISKSQRNLWVSFYRTDSGLCIYHLFVWSNFNFLHNFQWITLPTQSYLFIFFSYLKNPELFFFSLLFLVIVILLVFVYSVPFILTVISPSPCFSM